MKTKIRFEKLREFCTVALLSTVVIMAVCAAKTASAATPFLAWSGSGVTNGFGAITNGIVVPPGDGVTVVHHMVISADLATAVVHVLTNGVPVASTNNSSTTTVYGKTNNLAGNTWVLIQYGADNFCEARRINSVGDGTITVNLAPTRTVGTGDTLYPAGVAYTFPVGTMSLGATNRELSNVNGVITGRRKNEPLGFFINLTAAAGGGVQSVGASYTK